MVHKNLTERLIFRATAEQRRAFEQAAKKQGQPTVSSWLRSLALKHAAESTPEQCQAGGG